jgi:hypothetical protein
MHRFLVFARVVGAKVERTVGGRGDGRLSRDGNLETSKLPTNR